MLSLSLCLLLLIRYDTVIATGAGRMTEEVLVAKQKQLDEYVLRCAGVGGVGGWLVVLHEGRQ